jgi:hypothetical protein
MENIEEFENIKKMIFEYRVIFANDEKHKNKFKNSLI